MPSSRRRPGQHHYAKNPPAPHKERTDGRTFWAIMMGVFGLIIAYFASGNNVVALVIGALVGAVAGYYIGKSMEKDIPRKAHK
jgi:uncharacterized membrane protein YfcA